MAISVGSVAVSVVPSAEGFREKLRAQIGNLPNIELVLETAAAEAKIEEVRAALDSITNKHVDVDVDDHGSAARARAGLIGVGGGADFAGGRVLGMSALIVAGLAAIIPVAAAASAAIAGIGAGIGLGIAGLLVGKLALGAIPQALKAQPAAGASSSGGGTNQALTEQSRALQVSQALNSQRQAEVALATAQRNARDAQAALTQARVDAAEALQNLSNQVTDNGLAQRQAVLDLATARQNLNVANANPDAANAANKDALAQIQLSYDQARQNLTELKEKGSDLADQQAKANKAGVGGSQQVVAAQQQVIDTQNALRDAQFRVTDAAGQLALAQNRAADATGAAGAATGAYGAALAKLNPAQAKFLAFLQSIRGQFSQISAAAAGGLLPGLQVAITNLLPYLPAFAKFVGDIARGFGDLAVDASKALTGPFWTQFFIFLDRITDPAISTFGQVLGGLFKVAAAAFQAFYPALTAVGGQLGGFLDRVAKAIQGGALAGFTNYVVEHLPQVGRFLDAFGRALGNLISALAPIGGAILGGLTGLLNAIASVPASVIQDMALALFGIAAAMQAVKLAQAAGPLIGVLIENPEIAAVLAVAAGVFLLYQHSKTFRDFVDQHILPTLRQLWGYLQNTVYPILKRIAQDAFDGLKNAIKTVGDAIEKNRPQLEQLVGAFKAIVDFVITKVLPVLGPILQGAFQVIGFEIGQTISQIAFLIRAFDAIVVGAAKVYGGIVTAFTNVKNFITGTFSTIETSVGGFVTRIVNAIAGIPGRLLTVGQAFLDAGKTLMGKIFDGLVGAVKNGAGFAADLAKAIVNKIIDLINDVVPHKIHVGFSAGPVHFSQDIPFLPKIDQLRATGGAVFPGQTYGVNEQGLEAFMPLIPGFITTASDTQRLTKAFTTLASQAKTGRGGGDTNISVVEAFNARATAAEVNRQIRFA